MKNSVKKIVPPGLWNLLRYLKHTPDAIRRSIIVLTTNGMQGLRNEINRLESLDGVQRDTGYWYYEPLSDKSIKQAMASFAKKPLISIIIPVCNVDPKWMNVAIKSVKNQWYKNWELCIVVDESANKDTIDLLKSASSSKVKVNFSAGYENTSVVLNGALELARGEYVALMDSHDALTRDALYEIVKTINKYDAEFIYSDEDQQGIDGSFSDPNFKPDFAPDMLLSQNYLSHLVVMKKELITKVHGFTAGLEGAQDYDLYLKVLEYTDKIHHIQKVLYHWRKIPGTTTTGCSNKSYTQDPGITVLENAMERRCVEAEVLNGKHPDTYRIKYAIKGEPLVSIVIPFNDKPELLRTCLESILEKSTYKNFEVIGISNNSKEKETFTEMKRLESLDERIHFHEYNVPFNYSDINNYAVNTYTKGEHIILLNNDIEIITSDWIESMLEFSQRSDVGAVGAKLYYPDDTIQHAGVIIGLGGVAGHSHKHYSQEHSGYFCRLNLIQNFSAVTAACLMVKKTIFNEVNGLNEQALKIAFNDVDFCLRIREKGYLNVFTPYCEAYHHESVSRGDEDTVEKQQRFADEVKYIQLRHKDILTAGDPFYNPNLTLDREDFSIR